jgi:hypothetical protein
MTWNISIRAHAAPLGAPHNFNIVMVLTRCLPHTPASYPCRQDVCSSRVCAQPGRLHPGS